MREPPDHHVLRDFGGRLRRVGAGQCSLDLLPDVSILNVLNLGEKMDSFRMPITLISR